MEQQFELASLEHPVKLKLEVRFPWVSVRATPIPNAYTERIACILCMHLGACFFYAPNCINALQKVNLKKMHPAAFHFPCPYTNGISLRIIIKDFIITQSLIN